MALKGILNNSSTQTPNNNNINTLGYLFGTFLNEGSWDSGCNLSASLTPNGFVNIGKGAIIFKIGEGSSLVFYNDAIEQIAVSPNPTNGTIINQLVYAKLDLQYDLGGNPSCEFGIAVGTNGVDPALPDNIPNGIFCVPLGRIAKVYSVSGVLTSSEIVVAGNTNNANVEPVRPISILQGSTTLKFFTQAEFDSGIWKGGEYVIKKGVGGDINNTFWVNFSQTSNPIWKQVVLVAQFLNRWNLLITQNIPTAPSSFNLLENQGTPSGGFTIPAGFWTVGKTITVTDNYQQSGSVIGNAGSPTFDTSRLFNINGTLVSTCRILRRRNNGGSIGNIAINMSLNMRTFIECVQIIGSNAQLRVLSEDYSNGNYVGGVEASYSWFKAADPETLITMPNNVPIVMSVQYNSTVSGATSGPGAQITQFSIQTQQ